MEVKPTKTNWGPKFGLNGPKLGPKLGFVSFFKVWFISLEIAQDDSLEYFLTTNRGETHEKKSREGPNWV